MFDADTAEERGKAQAAAGLSADEIRKAVRFEVKNGANVIKAAVSGGVVVWGGTEFGDVAGACANACAAMIM